MRDAFLKEQPSLLALPDNPFNSDEVKQARAPKTPYIRFDLNDYSIPHQQVQKTLTVHAKLHRGQDRLSHASSHSADLLQHAIERGHTLKASVRLLNQLLDDYGPKEFHISMGEALAQQSPYPQAVQQILERRRDNKNQPPPLAFKVPDKVKNISIKAADLSDYDQLNKGNNNDKS